MLRGFAALALLAAFPALAQDAAAQRELIQRAQQSDAFSLQLRQSQQQLKIPPGDLRARREAESRHRDERQRLENVSERQRLDATTRETPPELKAYERQKADDERRPLARPGAG